MNYENTLNLIQESCWAGSHLGLDRMNELMFLLGNPEKHLRFIHVAGTNGKGSVCAMLSSILTAAGYKVGLYTSPHLNSYCERFKINGNDISEEEFYTLVQNVVSYTKLMHDKPTEYELITALALLWFAKQDCDIVVLEVGLGGRLDATNVIPIPEAAIITNIGLEHTDILGATLPEIAAEKAGIIKKTGAVVTYPSTPEVETVYQTQCQKKRAMWKKVSFNDVTAITDNLDGQCFTWKKLSNLNTPLIGKHQRCNAAVVLETLNILQKRGWVISEESIRTGLTTVNWPARLEVLSRNPLFLLDGAHNPQCAQMLAENLRTLLPGKKFIFVVGVLADKDYPAVLKEMIPRAHKFICLTPNNTRALPARELASYLIAQGANASFYDDFACGITAAFNSPEAQNGIIAFGSLYLAGQIRNLFPSVSKKQTKCK